MRTRSSLEAIQPGTRVGVDANIYVYHFAGRSRECTSFLLRCEIKEIDAYVTTTALAEVLHRMMIIEALERGLIRGPNPARRLREHPDVVRRLRAYAQAGEAALQIGTTLLAPGVRTFQAAQEIRDQHGLLVNDSLLVAALRERGVATLASADPDFERVPGLSVHGPTDIALDGPSS